MKKILAITALFTVLFSFQLKASKYYISRNGNDLNDGRTASTSWKSIAKVNSIFSTLHPGDSILFKCGDNFFGSLIINTSGTPGKPIVISYYGIGRKPLVTGFTKIFGWSKLRGNVWESRLPVSTLATCNMVVINGMNSAMGRYPNTGYLTYQTHQKNTSITSRQLNDGKNWTGAEVVIRMTRFGLDRNRITEQVGTTLNYISEDNMGGEPTDGFGFFIQDDANTLDTINEWYYNRHYKKLQVYSVRKPSNIQLATLNILVTVNKQQYVTITGISFEGSNETAIKSVASEHVKIENCDINFTGFSAINLGTTSNYATINNCDINNSNDVGIINDTSARVTITNNIIKNSGVFAGMGTEFLASRITWLTTLGNHIGIRSAGNYVNISFNKIDSSGYHAIFFNGDSAIIEGNSIDTYCFIKDDGGGVYSYSELSKKVWLTRTIENNIILHGIGAPLGTIDVPSYNNQTAGIYLDAANGNFNVKRNTVAYSDKGLFINNGRDINVVDNTFYNNRYNLFLSNYSKTLSMKNISIRKNIVFAGPNTALNIEWELQPDTIVGTKIPASYYADSNYYAGKNLSGLRVAQNYKGHERTISEWKSYTGQELNSKAILVGKNIRFEYNQTKANKIIRLTKKYTNVKGKIYSGKISLPPFSSLVLIESD